MALGDETTLLEVLGTVEKRGELQGLELEVWTGGGEPPPHYRSDQFRLLSWNGRDTIQFARPLYYPGREPSALIEKFLMPAKPDEVKALARLIREACVFTKRYAEEENPGIADIYSTEVIVTVNGKAHQRRYFRRVPEAVKPLLDEVGRLTAKVKFGGKRGLYEKGKEVPEPPVPPSNP
jgi:hypothetical protein